MDRRRFLQALGASGVLALAGCSADDGGSGTTNPETTTTTATTTEAAATTDATAETTTTTATTTTESTTTETTTAATTTSTVAQVVTVAPGGKFRFSPSSFTVATGSTVRWEWDGAGHNVRPTSQPDDADWPGDDEDLYGEGHTHEYTFTVPGEYEYECVPHASAGMVGSFQVE